MQNKQILCVNLNQKVAVSDDFSLKELKKKSSQKQVNHK